ncbi:hypothetical protein M885DRAFT_622406, partial [Pelagophyceae sp. CCMP2097]
PTGRGTLRPVCASRARLYDQRRASWRAHRKRRLRRGGRRAARRGAGNVQVGGGRLQAGAEAAAHGVALPAKGLVRPKDHGALGSRRRSSNRNRNRRPRRGRRRALQGLRGQQATPRRARRAKAPAGRFAAGHGRGRRARSLHLSTRRAPAHGHASARAPIRRAPAARARSRLGVLWRLLRSLRRAQARCRDDRHPARHDGRRRRRPGVPRGALPSADHVQARPRVARRLGVDGGSSLSALRAHGAAGNRRGRRRLWLLGVRAVPRRSVPPCRRARSGGAVTKRAAVFRPGPRRGAASTRRSKEAGSFVDVSIAAFRSAPKARAGRAASSSGQGDGGSSTPARGWSIVSDVGSGTLDGGSSGASAFSSSLDDGSHLPS